MDVAGWQRRRRRAIAAGAGVVLLVVVGVLVIGEVVPAWRSVVSLLWVAAAAGSVALALARRPRRLQARLHAVTALLDADADAVASLVQVSEGHAMWWVGSRGLATPCFVLVDDAEGYALWDARRRGPVEVMRCPWSDVATAVARDEGAWVDLVPEDPARPTIRLTATELRDEPPQAMQTPKRQRALAARLRARIRAQRPDAAPEPPAAGSDVDWLAPPDRTPPPR